MAGMSDPLAPPPPPPMAPPPFLPPRVPGQIQVFAVLHLVFAGIGLLYTAFSAVMEQFSSRMLQATKQSGELGDLQIQLTVEIERATHGLKIFGYATTVILAGLMITAGIHLLKRRATGLKWSNIYSWSSISVKLLSAVMFFSFVLPQLDDFLSRASGQGGKVEEFFATTMKFSLFAGSVIGPLVACLYPALALLLLNRPLVRRALGCPKEGDETAA